MDDLQSGSRWLDANQAFVTASIRLAEARLEAALARARSEPSSSEPCEVDPALAERVAQLRNSMQAPPALQRLAGLFALSPFEYELLVLCAAAELASQVGDACAALQGSPQRRWPSFGLGLAVLPEPHWSALSPERPLRRHRLLQVLPGSLCDAMLQIDERVLHEIVGVSVLDERLSGIVEFPDATWVPERFAPSLHEVAGCLSVAQVPVLLSGGSAASRRAIACAALREAGLTPLLVRTGDLPTEIADRVLLQALLQRELCLRDAGLIVETRASDAAERSAAAAALIDGLAQPVVATAPSAALDVDRPALRVTLETADEASQRALWLEVFGADAGTWQDVVEDLAEEFRLDPEEISALGAEWRVRLQAGVTPEDAPGQHSLRDRARSLNRARYAGLAQVIVPCAQPDALVLPAAQAQTIVRIEQHLRHRGTVLGRWGFGARDGRGLGVTALFHGPSGTGKTLAAEVLAARLGLDLVRVDLSQIVSKYIGETEKNLGRIFDAAERGGVVLLFDEADALFGKRSEVRDSHDRYANIEVGYLLQRMEAFRGLAILTTNLRQSLDAAFLRRLRFVVGFPFPDAQQRMEIWRRVLPPQLPRGDVDIVQLARLNVTGGNIRNIALHAAYLAAADGRPVGMRHMLQASKEECVRMDKSVTQAEVGGWA